MEESPKYIAVPQLSSSSSSQWSFFWTANPIHCYSVNRVGRSTSWPTSWPIELNRIILIVCEDGIFLSRVTSILAWNDDIELLFSSFYPKHNILLITHQLLSHYYEWNNSATRLMILVSPLSKPELAKHITSISDHCCQNTSILVNISFIIPVHTNCGWSSTKSGMLLKGKRRHTKPYFSLTPCKKKTFRLINDLIITSLIYGYCHAWIVSVVNEKITLTCIYNDEQIM